MALAPRAAVAPPMAQPPRVGLLPSLPLTPGQTDPESERWQAGFRFAPEGCGISGIANPCANEEKVIPDRGPLVEVEPFVVWAGDRCTSMNAWDWQARARRQLAAAESYQVAHELWTGTLAKTSTTPEGDDWPNRYLASPDSDVISDGPMAAIDALGCLEYALGQCLHGARGMIHATRQLVTAWNQQGHLRREANVILTIHDTIVVPDAGYDGSGPDGQPESAGSQWAYATDLVQIRMDAVVMVPDEAEMAAALDRLVNSVEWRAERMAAVSFPECCHLAVEVNQPLCGIGGS